MKHTPWRARARRTLATVVAVALGGGMLTATSAAAADPAYEVTGGSAHWGVKTSFRTYVTSPGADGTVEVDEPAAATDDGFTFAATGGTVTGDTAEVELAGGVTFRAHGGALEVSLADLRVVVDGTEGTLVADVRSRANSPGADPVDHPDVALATVDLTDAPLVVEEGEQTVARVTGAPVTLTADGVPAFAGFYPAGEELDPLSFEVTLERPEPEPGEPVWEPAVEVFAADGVTPLEGAEVTWGDTVVVRGTGFDPAGNVGGRGMPIPSDLPQGTYVVFGKFAEQWRPSQGAPSSARSVGSQKWALAREVLDQVPVGFRGAIEAQWAEVGPDGSFETTLTIAEPEDGWTVADGVLGVYTYAAGGVVNPDQELAVPLTVVDEPTEPEVPVWEPAVEVFAADGVTPLEGAEVTWGDTVVVRGTGFDPAGNVGGRGMPIPSDLPQGTYVVFGKFAEQWRPSQGAPSSARSVGSQKWALAREVLDQVPVGFRGAIEAQWAEVGPDGSFETTLTIAEPEDGWTVADGVLGVYTYAAGGVVNPDQELAVPLTVVDEPTEPEVPVWEPAVEVFAADGVTPLEGAEVTWGDTVVVRGTGFDPAGNVGGRGMPIPSDLPQGTYVVFGKFAEQWRPSQGAPSSARSVGSQKWALAREVLDQVPVGFRGAIEAQWAEVGPDGSFETTLTIAEPEDGWTVADGVLGVYTYAAGGVVNPDQELAVPLTVVDERVPQLEVSPTENLSYGTVVTVRGTGFAPDRKLSTAFTARTQADPEFGWPVGWLHHEVVTTDALGRFTREITISDWRTGTGDDCSEVQCWFAAFNSAQVSDNVEVDRRAERDQDVFVPVTFVAGKPSEGDGDGPTVTAEPNPVRRGETLTVTGNDLPAGETVTASLEPRTQQATGHLEWGVKDSFLRYVTGPVAAGTVTTSEEVTQTEDGTFRLPVTEVAPDLSVLSFAGTISFQGHEYDGTPALEIHLSDLRVQLTVDSAVLVADVTSREFAGTDGSVGELTEHTGAVLATLDRAAFGVTATQVQTAGAAATLTPEGEAAFGGFYDAGERLDPVRVDVTTGGLAPAALLLTAPAGTPIATADVTGTFHATWPVPTDFPIGAYDVVLRTESGEFLADTPLTVLAQLPAVDDGQDGDDEDADEETEEPEVTRGTVTVKPDPVERGATATIVGRDLTPGTRVGAVIDAAGEPGTLAWGVKDSFRSYITGPIAQGSVRVSAPASRQADGTVVFGSGSGSGDAENASLGFSGSVSFTGHLIGGSPALRVTITDPSVVIEDGVGHLVANVTSRSLDGSADVDYPRVRLARLDLSGVTVRDGRLVGTDVPATLTPEGVPAFADFYEAGDALDPVSFSVAVDDEALDLTALDVAEATVGEDGTVELTWQVPADTPLGTHRVDLVTDGESVADTTFDVVDADVIAAGGSGTTDGTGAGRLAQTGAQSAALAALAAVVIAAGALAVTRRQRA